MNFPRASGILLHPTSLPSAFGVGDLGDEAFKFVDFLAAAGQTYWQILPLGPTGYGDSPYQSFSAFAGNTNLISPELLVKDGFLSLEEINQKPDFEAGRVDFGALYDWKNRILRQAYERFSGTTEVDLRGQFETFCRQEASWLDDYALYRAVKLSQDQKPWYEWETALKLRDEAALDEARQDLREEIEAQKFYQYVFFGQWFDVKNRAAAKNIKIIGDIPIFVALDSSDVWCASTEFKLRKDGSPLVVAGVPPDYFSKTGQLWGNPIYDWEKMLSDGFSWWIERVRFTLRTVDIARIDHFIGFTRCWEVPSGELTAENGEWVAAPGKDLLDALENALGELPVIAEDLGVVTPEVEELRDSHGFPGMRIFQFGFGGDAKNQDLPHNYIKNCVAYTGTHDNETTRGWFESRKEKTADTGEEKLSREGEFCLKYLDSDAREIHWDFIRALWASVADTAIAPAQDLLGLDNEARMNAPATNTGNWQWQLKDGDLTDEIAERLRELTEIYGRI